MSEVTDENNGKVTLFSNFDEQRISLSEGVYPENRKMLRMSVYAGSPLEVKVNVSGNVSLGEPYSYSLPSHEWINMDIDLSGILSGPVNRSGSYIDGTIISGGTEADENCTDHVYFYEDGIAAGFLRFRNGCSCNYTEPGHEDRDRYRSDNPILELYLMI